MENRHENILPSASIENIPIAIIGLGGIGSHLALMLAKMGARNLELCDFDTVDEVNISSQAFTPDDIGKNKAEAIAEKLHAFNFLPTVHANRFTASNADILAVCVDSMATRKAIYEQLQPHQFIAEGRMGGELARIYAVDNTTPSEKYLAQLYSDEDAEPTPCGSRALAYNTQLTASLMASNIRKRLTGDPVPFEIVFDIKNLGLSVTR